MSGTIFISKDGGWEPLGQVAEDGMRTSSEDDDFGLPHDLDLLNGTDSFSCEVESLGNAMETLGIVAEKSRKYMLELTFDIDSILNEVEARRRECRRLASAFKRKRKVGGTRNHKDVVYGKDKWNGWSTRKMNVRVNAEMIGANGDGAVAWKIS